jgi:calpain-15
MVRPERIKNWETFVWKRPKEVYGKGKFKVFADIGPNDIKQGLCGDCYFLSAISSLAEIQKRVTDIFITEEVNEAGCYAMYFYINGEVKEVVVDDYFPYDTHKQTWAFSRSNKDNEIWVLLLEKAWAKICGSYQRIEAGTVGEALPYLCGAPSKFYYHEEMKS